VTIRSRKIRGQVAIFVNINYRTHKKGSHRKGSPKAELLGWPRDWRVYNALTIPKASRRPQDLPIPFLILSEPQSRNCFHFSLSITAMPKAICGPDSKTACQLVYLVCPPLLALLIRCYVFATAFLPRAALCVRVGQRERLQRQSARAGFCVPLVGRKTGFVESAITRRRGGSGHGHGPEVRRSRGDGAAL